MMIIIVTIIYIYLPSFGKVSPEGHDFLAEIDFFGSCKVFRH